MTQHRTRREVLAASPGVALAALGGVSAAALAKAEDGDAALLRLEQEWLAGRRRLTAHQDMWDALPPDERIARCTSLADTETALYEKVIRIQARIVDTPARTLAGLQIKARIVAHDHDHNVYGTGLADLERMLGDPNITDGRPGLSLAADILRLARMA